MWHRISCSAVLAVTLGLAACENQVVSPPNSNITAEDPATNDLHVAGQLVARFFAAGMREPEVRAGVRDAMRASLLTEHKLELQDFVETAPGRMLAAAAANAAGLSTDEVDRLVRLLGPMDFYMPRREHRLNWTISDVFAVGFAADEDANQFIAYTASGEHVRWNVADWEHRLPLFIIHPSEPKGVRIRAQAPKPGDVIQDPQDGEISISGFMPSTPNAEISSVSTVTFKTLAGDGFVSESGTYLQELQPAFGDGVGACEIYTKYSFYVDGSVVEGTKRYPSSGSIGGVPCPGGAFPFEPLPWGPKILNHGIAVGVNEWARLRLYEDDSFSDDDMGLFIFDASNRTSHDLRDEYRVYIDVVNSTQISVVSGWAN